MPRGVKGTDIQFCLGSKCATPRRIRRRTISAGSRLCYAVVRHSLVGLNGACHVHGTVRGTETKGRMALTCVKNSVARKTKTAPVGATYCTCGSCRLFGDEFTVESGIGFIGTNIKKAPSRLKVLHFSESILESNRGPSVMIMRFTIGSRNSRAGNSYCRDLIHGVLGLS